MITHEARRARRRGVFRARIVIKRRDIASALCTKTSCAMLPQGRDADQFVSGGRMGSPEPCGS